jgi:hypothetical protein
MVPARWCNEESLIKDSLQRGGRGARKPEGGPQAQLPIVLLVKWGAQYLDSKLKAGEAVRRARASMKEAPVCDDPMRSLTSIPVDANRSGRPSGAQAKCRGKRAVM